MQPLVPVPRQDKTGKIVIRHMKTGAANTAGKAAIPAPAAAPPKKKKAAKKPLASQFEPKQRDSYRSWFNADPAFSRAVGLKGTEWNMISLSHSDMEMFSVLSVVNPDEAMAAFEQKYSADFSVLEVLHKNGLGHLEVDRRDMMDEAMQRRLDPMKMIEMHSAYGIGNYDPKVFLDACKVRELTKSEIVNSGDKKKVFHEAILSGEVSYDDMMELGMAKVMKTGVSDRVLGVLKEIHSGSSRFDLEMLEKFARQSDHDGEFVRNEMLLDEYGHDFIKEVSYLRLAVDINTTFANRDQEYRRELIEYAEAGLPFLSGETPEDIAKLHAAGLPAKAAGRLITKINMDVDNVIAVMKEGIPMAVVEGWL